MDGPWIIDPKRRTQHVFQPSEPPREYTEKDTICDDAGLPGFECRVGEFFEEYALTMDGVLMPDAKPCLICGCENARQTPLNCAAAVVNAMEAMKQAASETLKCWCSNCGHYAVSHVADKTLRSPREHLSGPLRSLQESLRSSAYKVQALIAEHASQKLPTPYLLFNGESFHETDPPEPFAAVAFAEFLRRWPSTITERFDRILANLARTVDSIGQPIRYRENDRIEERLVKVCFTSNIGDAAYCIDALLASELLQRAESAPDFLFISPEGWRRVEELQRTRSNPRYPAFVAMWFGDDSQTESQAFMNMLYTDHIVKAVDRAGYKVDRVDLVPHNDFVMDKVMGMIRVAPFVVADFTGNRGGVYFEAGFARGLGIPVIHTCREGHHFDGAHFDIKQINTIRWREPPELQEKLHNRIAGTLGPGPYKRES